MAAVLDAYVQHRYGSSIPYQLATEEFFQLASDHLTTNGVQNTFLETEGAHTWMVWRRYLNQLAPLLFR